MTKPERDPRVDPRPGDIVKRQHCGTHFYVREVDTFDVRYQEWGTGELLWHPLDEWRKDAANDEVVARGPK